MTGNLQSLVGSNEVSSEDLKMSKLAIESFIFLLLNGLALVNVIAVEVIRAF